MFGRRPTATGKLSFSSDGTCTGDWGKEKKWKAVDERTVKCDDGTEMTFLADYTRYTGTSSLGNYREGARRADPK